ncbi:MAG: hypothetical protein J6P16_07410 [Eubacterium sp.]|nr:hypothetical protein [Eubacterium sp.]
MKTFKRKVVALYVSFVLLFSVVGKVAYVKPSSAATVKPELIIMSVQDMDGFSKKVANGNSFAGKTVVLGTDLDYSGSAIPFECVGIDETHEFSGTFDGMGHTISGISMTEKGMGIFARTANSGIIKNLRVSKAFIQDRYIGGIVGINYGTITNCVIADSTLLASSGVGGITYFNIGSVINCVSSGNTIKRSENPTSASQAGGVAAYSCGLVANSCNMSAVSVLDALESAGGVVGEAESGSVENCINTGSITGGAIRGGVAGKVSAGAAVKNSFSVDTAAPKAIGVISTDSSEAGCALYTASYMLSDPFRNNLNNYIVSYQNSWAKWTSPNPSEFPTPEFPGALDQIEGLSSPLPSVSPTPTPEVQITQIPQATIVPKASASPVPVTAAAVRLSTDLTKEQRYQINSFINYFDEYNYGFSYNSDSDWHTLWSFFRSYNNVHGSWRAYEYATLSDVNKVSERFFGRTIGKDEPTGYNTWGEFYHDGKFYIMLGDGESSGLFTLIKSVNKNSDGNYECEFSVYEFEEYATGGNLICVHGDLADKQFVDMMYLPIDDKKIKNAGGVLAYDGTCVVSAADLNNSDTYKLVSYKTNLTENTYDWHEGLKSGKNPIQLITSLNGKVKKLKALKNNKLKVKFVISSKIDWQQGLGFEIEYKTGSEKKVKKLNDVYDPVCVLKKLKNGKKYTVRIRPFQKFGNKKYYGKWSDRQSIRMPK